MAAVSNWDCKFAITIPCYNSESTIADTLQGIMDQGEALERVICVVIADDSSPDKTLDVVRDVWRLNHPPLRFASRRTNLGEMVNVNTTVAELPNSAEWFLHMHGDNIPKQGWLRSITDRCLTAASRTGIVCASYDVFYDDGETKTGEERPNAPPVLVHGSNATVRDTIRKGCWWHNSCSAVRVSTFLEVGGFPPGMRQKGDWDFLLRVLKSGWDIEYLPRTLMRYRLSDSSASGFALRRHLDIEESLQVIQKHAGTLGAGDIAFTHAQYAWALTRRFGASLTRGEFLRADNALRMLIRTTCSCISCLVTP